MMTNQQKSDEIVRECSKLPGLNEYEAMYHCSMEMAKWKDSEPISAETFRQCIQMLNDTCYESGTGVDEADIEYTIKKRKLV